MFTLDELSSLKKSQLLVLAAYFKIPIKESDPKDKITKIMYERLQTISETQPVSYEPQGIQMSVRVRRIKESQNGTK